MCSLSRFRVLEVDLTCEPFCSLEMRGSKNLPACAHPPSEGTWTPY